MFETLASLLIGVTAAVVFVLSAEKAARWVETDAKRRRGQEQAASLWSPSDHSAASASK